MSKQNNIRIRQDATGIHIDWHPDGRDPLCRHSIGKTINYQADGSIDPVKVFFFTFNGYHTPAQARAAIAEQETICAAAEWLDRQVKKRTDFQREFDAVIVDDGFMIREIVSCPYCGESKMQLGTYKCEKCGPSCKRCGEIGHFAEMEFSGKLILYCTNCEKYQPPEHDEA